MKTVTLNLIAHHIDNHDGSTSVRLFNNREELKKYLEKSVLGYRLDDIESGYDPYEYGTLTKHSIKLEIDPDTGLAKLSQPITLTSDD